MKFTLLSLLLILHLTAAGQKSVEHCEKANEAVSRGEYHKAIPSYLKSIKHDHEGYCGTKVKGKAHGDLGYAYFRAGDSLNALVYYNRAIQLNRHNPFPRVNKAALFLMQKNQHGAIKELDELIRYNPTYVDGYVQRGFIHHSEKQYEKAKIDLEKALSLDSTQHSLPPPLIQTIQKKLSEMEAPK